MTSVRYDVDGVDVLVADFEAIEARSTNGLNADVKKATKIITAEWRADARKKSGSHGKHYPGTIRPEMTSLFSSVIGPLSAMPQGGMGPGFEYGTPTVARKQGWPGAPFRRGGEEGGWYGGPRIGQRVGQNKPHLSMNITCDKQFPAFVVSVEATVAKVIG